ncbi:hypothetical protein PILCRDRAFT_15636 [Piloderma croceum F 1598]|uniref:Uncharacterized protein n=1 Tax=Piloderma croceum (strain F 1598) TaxID=765440 RepID=A0A0C3EYD1_PILCF|nr:hypothetical protein PILCRDRAFT_15636 [Piloderma croceum F 1598]
MNFYYIFLLLLVVLSTYSESPQQAPILPQSWVFGPVLPQNNSQTNIQECR